MPKIEAGSTANSFTVDGFEYIRGFYDFVYYQQGATDPEVGIRRAQTNEILIQPTTFSNWVDSTDTPYASTAALVTAIAGFIK